MKNFKLFKAFSLVELMISLITISCIAAAFTPVITKKLKKQDIALSLAQTSEISDNCGKESGLNFGSDTDGYKCKLCTKAYCIQCGLTDCGDGKYIDSKKCVCKNCKTDGGLNNCVKCVQENANLRCIQCEAGNGNPGTGYYLKSEVDNSTHDKCQKCRNGSYCEDGIWEKRQSVCQNPPRGYFCKDNKLTSCSYYNTNCNDCNETICKSCAIYYTKVTAAEGWCKYCGPECPQCTFKADGIRSCTQCNGDWYHDTTNNACPNVCRHYIPNCQTCTPAPTPEQTVCTSCNGGYNLINGRCDNTCSGSIPNCLGCSNGKCLTCDGGYYLKNGACVKCPNIANCVQCDMTGTMCESCKPGYYLSENKKSCIVNDNNFRCSDANFMRIGNLCVTRKNMGDISMFPIPSSISVAEASKEYCYPTSEVGCCWKGKGVVNSSPCATSGVCDRNGSYDIERIVCTPKAASDICANFKYAGKTWRLPKPSEVTSWARNTLSHGDNGLGLCSWFPVDLPINTCGFTYNCYGAGQNVCRVTDVITSDTSISLDISAYQTAIYGTTGKGANGTGSVRCVTEME